MRRKSSDVRYYPVATARSFRLALESLCDGETPGPCMETAVLMLSDTRRTQLLQQQQQADGGGGNDAAAASQMPFILQYAVPHVCQQRSSGGGGGGGGGENGEGGGGSGGENNPLMPLDLALCTLLPFAEYVVVVESTSSSSSSSSLSCCEASAMVVADLLRQVARGFFEAAVCQPADADGNVGGGGRGMEGGGGIAGGEEGVCTWLEEDDNSTLLGNAKGVLRASPACVSATWDLLEALATSTSSDDGITPSHQLQLQAMALVRREHLESYLAAEDDGAQP